MTATIDRSKLIVTAMSEHDLERFVRYLAEIRHLPAFHVINSRRAVTLKGWPDWTIVGTRVLFRELKSERGRVTPDQQQLGQAILAAGGNWAVWRPTDLKSGAVEQQLDAIAVRQGRSPNAITTKE